MENIHFLDNNEYEKAERSVFAKYFYKRFQQGNIDWMVAVRDFNFSKIDEDSKLYVEILLYSSTSLNRIRFQDTNNPMYVWDAIDTIDEVEKNTPYEMKFPSWIKKYLYKVSESLIKESVKQNKQNIGKILAESLMFEHKSDFTKFGKRGIKNQIYFYIDSLKDKGIRSEKRGEDIFDLAANKFNLDSKWTAKAWYQEINKLSKPESFKISDDEIEFQNLREDPLIWMGD